MVAKKISKKLRGGRQEGKAREIRKPRKGISKGHDFRASPRQTRSAAKNAPDRVNGASSSLDGEETNRKRKRIGNEGFGLKPKNDDITTFRREKPHTRACTQFARLVSQQDGSETGLGATEELQFKEIHLPSVMNRCWTEQQERALMEALSIIKPATNFWSRIADRVSGRSAEDCYNKFYSGRSTTRSSKRLRPEELESSPADKTGNNRMGSFGSDTTMPTKTRVRKLRPIRHSTIGTTQKESKASRQGCNHDALPRQTRAKSQGTKCRIDEASSSPQVVQINATKPHSTMVTKGKLGQRAEMGSKSKTRQHHLLETQVVQTDALKPGIVMVIKAKLGQRAERGSKNKTRKFDLLEKPQDRAGAQGNELGSGIDRSLCSDGGKEIEIDSHIGGSLDWTKNEETALQDAYSTLRPSAEFWYLVSKQVPGRSAEECFNKFYSAHPTPPRAPLRSSLKEMDCPLFLSNPPKAKSAGGKQRLLGAHRIVRNILRKQQVDDEDYEADAFAALEHPDVVQSVMQQEDEAAMLDETDSKLSVDIPPGNSENSTTLQSDKENRKPKVVGQSRNFSNSQSHLCTPEVLKQVKDPVMLDKYIDHLHQRQTRRPSTKLGQKNSKKITSVAHQQSKDGLDFGNVKSDAVHRAKQELRDVFLRVRREDGNFFDLIESTNDEEEDGESVDSQMALQR